MEVDRSINDILIYAKVVHSPRNINTGIPVYSPVAADPPKAAGLSGSAVHFSTKKFFLSLKQILFFVVLLPCDEEACICL